MRVVSTPAGFAEWDATATELLLGTELEEFGAPWVRRGVAPTP